MGWPPPTHEPAKRRRILMEAEQCLAHIAAQFTAATSPDERARATRRLRKQAQTTFAARLALIKARHAIFAGRALTEPVSGKVAKDLAGNIRQEVALHELGVEGIIEECLKQFRQDRK